VDDALFLGSLCELAEALQGPYRDVRVGFTSVLPARRACYANLASSPSAWSNPRCPRGATGSRLGVRGALRGIGEEKLESSLVSDFAIALSALMTSARARSCARRAPRIFPRPTRRDHAVCRHGTRLPDAVRAVDGLAFDRRIPHGSYRSRNRPPSTSSHAAGFERAQKDRRPSVT